MGLFHRITVSKGRVVKQPGEIYGIFSITLKVLLCILMLVISLQFLTPILMQVVGTAQ